MEFKEGADVFTADGEKVGEIDRVVIDPRTNTVSHVIVEKGFLLPTDRVVHVSLIRKAVEDRVELRDVIDDLEVLPEFQEFEYVPADEADLEEPPAGAVPLYWYPAAGTAWWDYTGRVTYPGYWGYARPPFVAEMDRNIPEGAVALREGARVISRDGEHVGDIEAIFSEAEGNRVTHLLLSRGFFLSEEKLIPTTWVALVMEDEVHLTVNADFIEGLPTYEEEE